MNRTKSATSRQAFPLNESTVVDSDNESTQVIPYDHPSWLLSPVVHNGLAADAIFWQLGDDPAVEPVEAVEAIPDERFALSFGNRGPHFGWKAVRRE